jgi:glycosyltransferase involved in cell wall biosynthesis
MFKQTVTPVTCDRASAQQRIMLFDLSIRGHHPSYIKHLIHYWQQHYRHTALSAHLDIVTAPEFLTEHADVVALVEKGDRIQFTAITPSESAALASRKNGWTRLRRSFQEWKLFCQYAATLKATEGMLMYFDTAQPPISFGLKAPCPVSGIYFRPTFHYDSFSAEKYSLKERFQQQREIFSIKRVLRHPQLKTLFCLDPFAVKRLDAFSVQSKAVYLPDPVEVHQPSVDPGTLKESLGIDQNRTVFLLFGALTTRKGVYQLLDALSMLSPELCQKICILLVGESKLSAELETRIAMMSQLQSIQFVRQYEFVPDEAVPNYFQAADVVLAPYQRHVGMSGILLLAAAAQKPVLSSDYGLMGEVVRRYGLGLAVDSTRPDAIATGLMHCLLHAPEQLGDRTKMQTFAEENHASRFAQIIFQHLDVRSEVASAAQIQR